jgi:SAM-dependent methyltransferase/CheY-like chemotaxis protein
VCEYRVLFIDDKAGEEDSALFGRDCREGATVLKGGLWVKSVLYPDEVLDDLQRGKLEYGKLKYNALLLDVNFEALDQPLRFIDPPSHPQDQWGIDVLRTVKRMDPDFPVILLTDQSGQQLSYEAGRFRADDFVAKTELAKRGNERARERHLKVFAQRVRKAVENCGVRAVYDHKHLETADDFANDYDQEERAKPATVAYYHFENDLIDRVISDRLCSIPPDRKLRLLDVGCGTGRIEEFLATRRYCSRLEVTAVDFAGKMLKAAEHKLMQLAGKCAVAVGEAPEAADGELEVSLFRATAEDLDFLQVRQPEGFDVVVAGFGLLSYVKYADVLPASPEEAPARGLHRLLREDGALLFSVYNEDSLIYDRIKRLGHADEEIPIAALMDLAQGGLRVGKRTFSCEAFAVPRFTRFVRQAGFLVSPEDVYTFPTLHLALKTSEAEAFDPDPAFPPARFSPSLYGLDLNLSKVLGTRGHYVTGVAKKSEVRWTPGYEYEY